MNEKIVWHHVGARESNDKFPLPPEMRDLAHTVFYDADPDAAGGAQNVLPYCILDAEKNVNFHVTFESAVSSVFPFNEAFGDFVRLTPEGYDAPMSEASRTVKEIQLEARTIDGLVAAGACPPPDVLTIVAQGSSWEVLKGAENALKNHTLCVYADLEMLPVHCGQRLFDESFRLLSEYGLRFAFFSGFRKWRPVRQPLGARGPGFDIVGKAVFFKMPEKLAGDGTALRKQAVIALTYGQFDLAFQCLQRVAETPEASGAAAEQSLLHSFTDEIWPAYARLGNRCPQMMKRPEQAVRTMSAEAKHPLAARFISRGSRPWRLLKAARDITQNARIAVTDAAQAPSALEQKLHQRGFHSQAEDLRRIRLAEEKTARLETPAAPLHERGHA